MTNIAGLLSRMARGDGKLFDKLEKNLREGNKISVRHLRELNKEKEKAERVNKRLMKQIAELAESDESSTKEGKIKLRQLIQQRQNSVQYSNSLDGVIAAQRGVAASSTVMGIAMAAATAGLTIIMAGLALAIKAVVSAFTTWYEIEEERTKALSQAQRNVGFTVEQLGRLQEQGESLADSDVFFRLTGDINQVGMSIEHMTNVAGAMRNSRMVTEDLAMSFLTLERSAGLSAEQSANLFRLLGTGLEEPQEAFDGFIRRMQDFANDTGANFGTLMRDAEAAQSEIAQFGNIGEQTFRDAAVMASRFGFETKKIFEMVKKFDTFQSAANSVNTLNAMFGTSLSAYEMMIEQDPTRRLENVRQAVMDVGLAWGEMDRQQTMQIAELLNVTEAEAARLFADGISFEQLNQEREQREQERVRNERIGITNQQMLNRLLGSTVEHVVTMFDWFKKTWVVISQAIAPIFREVLGITGDIGEGFHNWIKSLVNSAGFQRTVRNLAEGIRDAVEKIQQFIAETDWADVERGAGVVWNAVTGIMDQLAGFAEWSENNEDLLRNVFDLGVIQAIGHSFTAVGDAISGISNAIFNIGMAMTQVGSEHPIIFSLIDRLTGGIATSLGNRALQQRAEAYGERLQGVRDTFQPTSGQAIENAPAVAGLTNTQALDNRKMAVHTHITVELDGNRVARSTATNLVNGAISGRA